MRPRLSIALFIPTLEVGGAERVLITLGRGLAQMGHRVSLVVAGHEGDFLRQIPPNVEVVLLGQSRLARALLPFARWLRRVRPDIVISALDAANVTAIVAAAFSGSSRRVIPTVHQNMTRSLVVNGGLKRFLISTLAACAYRWTEAVVCVSQGVADDLVRSHGVAASQVRVLPNAVVTPEMLRTRRTRFATARTGGVKVIVAAGRLAPPKDFETIIRAFAIARNERSARLVLLGEGPRRRMLECLVRDLQLESHVEMPGVVENVAEYLANADLFVLSSNYEGLPTVIVEALAMGCPVVSTDCQDGPRELLSNGVGVLVDIGDAKQMAAAMVRALDRPVAASVLRNRVIDYGLDTATRRYVDLIEEVLGGREITPHVALHERRQRPHAVDDTKARAA